MGAICVAFLKSRARPGAPDSGFSATMKRRWRLSLRVGTATFFFCFPCLPVLNQKRSDSAISAGPVSAPEGDMLLQGNPDTLF
jgi:hypothetical protein